MSGDHSASSFGDPNAQPPTPKQTPTSLVFPSSVFETPKNNQGHFDEAGGWTPRFAEEYSVFNASPGNLRCTQGLFVDFATQSPYQPCTGQKRPLSAGGIAAEIATHVNHFSTSPNLPLPPVDPSKRLQSSPGPSITSFEQADSRESQSRRQEGYSKKARRRTVVEDTLGQTATPPPSARKGDRKLVPKRDTNKMQDEQDFGQPDFGRASQQANMGAFVTTPSDMFGYPLSAPATAPAFTDQRSFWDTGTDLAGMDIDFTNGASVFQSPVMAHRPMGSIDWGKSNQIFQETGVAPGGGQGNVSPTKRGGPLAPKPMHLGLENVPTDADMFAASYPTGAADPFGIVGNGGVDPGLLFGRPQSSGMDMIAIGAPIQAPVSSLPSIMGQTIHINTQVPVVSKAPMEADLRRSASVKELGPSKQIDRAPVSSSVKTSGRPGLSRSHSETRGRKALPALAPAAPRYQTQSSSVNVTNRPIATQSSRPSRRVSPSKSQHQRLSSLSSIPENTGPRTRTEAKFTIDAHGRARVETIVIVEEEPLGSSIHKNHSAQFVTQPRRWNSSDEDYDSSSTDDEPIIIPSRNTSFVLPDPRKPTSRHPFHHSSRSVSDQSTVSHKTQAGGSQDDPDSEAETVMNDLSPSGAKSGDAASELRKLRESRHKKASAAKSRRLGPALSTGGFNGGYPAQNIMSPTTLTDTCLPTPSSSRSFRVRCVCNRPEVDQAGDDFMVQCESCEMFLHSRCVNVSKRTTVSSIFICAFCANTPVARGSRMRDSGRNSGVLGPPTSASSPLAHKSYRSFR